MQKTVNKVEKKKKSLSPTLATAQRTKARGPGRRRGRQGAASFEPLDLYWNRLESTSHVKHSQHHPHPLTWLLNGSILPELWVQTLQDHFNWRIHWGQSIYFDSSTVISSFPEPLAPTLHPLWPLNQLYRSQLRECRRPPTLCSGSAWHRPEASWAHPLSAMSSGIRSWSIFFSSQSRISQPGPRAKADKMPAVAASVAAITNAWQGWSWVTSQ